MSFCELTNTLNALKINNLLPFHAGLLSEETQSPTEGTEMGVQIVSIDLPGSFIGHVSEFVGSEVGLIFLVYERAVLFQLNGVDTNDTFVASSVAGVLIVTDDVVATVKNLSEPVVIDFRIDAESLVCYCNCN